MMTLEQEIQHRLIALEPEFLDIIDDSAHHVGHTGAKDGGRHLQLIIISHRFNGLSRVARHRLVYQLLGNLIPARIHALAVKAITPSEV